MSGLGPHAIEMASFTCKRVLGPMSGFAQRLLVLQCPFPEPSLPTPICPAHNSAVRALKHGKLRRSRAHSEEIRVSKRNWSL